MKYAIFSLVVNESLYNSSRNMLLDENVMASTKLVLIILAINVIT